MKAVGGSLGGGCLGGLIGIIAGGLIGYFAMHQEMSPQEKKTSDYLLGAPAAFDACGAFFGFLVGAGVGGVIGSIAGSAIGAGAASASPAREQPAVTMAEAQGQPPDRPSAPAGEPTETELARLEERIAELKRNKEGNADGQS